MDTTQRLDVVLVRRKLARSRDEAARLIAAGRVHIDGRPARKRAALVAPDQSIEVADDPDDPGYVSRGGYKLAGALADFAPQGLQVAGRRCLDLGASTGGFTDVLLRTGAAHVTCVDVGRDQLVPVLRDHPATAVFEGTDARRLTAKMLGGRVALVVADLSFISLTLVLPVLSRVAAEGADAVVLVKPQFEVGRERLGKGGVVRDPQLHAEALQHVVRAAADAGWGARAATRSRLPGPAGNAEFFLWLREGESAPDISQSLAAAVSESRPDVAEA